LPVILEDGTLTANFKHSSFLFGNTLSADLYGSAKLSSNTIEREFALEAEVNLYGETIDANAFMNRESLALRLGILDDRYYGITYDTFRDDIRAFGRLIFLDDETMDMLADIVDQINEVMNREEISDDYSFEAYSDVFKDFVKSLKVKTARSAYIDSDEERIRCKGVEITISKEAILELLNGLYDIIENDDILRTQFEMYNNSLFQGDYVEFSNYNQLLKEIGNVIRNFERHYEGDIVLRFFISKEDRLLKLFVSADINYDEEYMEVRALFDFGTDIEDRWEFDFFQVDGSDSSILNIVWDYEVLSEKHENSLYISGKDIDSITLISDWNRENGDFELAYEDGMLSGELMGNLITEDDTFKLLLDNVFPYDANNSLKIDIRAEKGSQIEKVSYINIDRWGNELIGAVMRFMLGRVFS